MQRRIAFLAVIAITTSLAGCGAKKEHKIVAKPAVTVELAIAAVSSLTDAIDVTGSLEPKNAVDVKTQIPGLVKQVFVNEWVKVAKGQPLLKIDIAETEALTRRAEASVASAKASLAQAKVSASRSERELERIRSLKASGLATQQTLDDAVTEQEASRARTDAAKAQVLAAEEELRQSRARLSKGLVIAPISGTVAEKNINVGDLTSDAAAAKPIFRIVDNSLLTLTVTIPSTESAKIKVGQPLEFTVDSLAGKVFKGKVSYINPELSPVDRSLKVVAEIKNVPELLKGGLFAKGRIITGEKKSVLMIPRSALGSLDLTAHTATISTVDGNVARMRKVKTGIASGENVEIVEGIKPGDKFVSRGGFNLKDGDAVTVAGAKP